MTECSFCHLERWIAITFVKDGKVYEMCGNCSDRVEAVYRRLGR